MKTSKRPKVYAIKVNNLSSETLSSESDEYFEKWRKFHQTKISPDKVSPDKVDLLENSRMTTSWKWGTSRHNEIYDHAGIPNKGWTYTDDDISEVSISGVG